MSDVLPRSTVPPQSSEELLERLFAIFPEYRTARRPLHDDALSFHSALIEFSTFLAGPACSVSERQLRAFGDLVSAAKAGGGPLENAFATCLLEHAGQLGVWKRLCSFLSRTAIQQPVIHGRCPGPINP